MAVSKIESRKNASAVAEAAGKGRENRMKGSPASNWWRSTADVPFAADGRSGKSTEEPAEDLLSDLQRGTRGADRGGALNLKPAYDWFYPYYRDRALCLALGMTPYEMLLQGVGAADDPSSGGRQMPSHWGHRKLNIVTQSSPTGTQFLQAVGCAEAGRYFSKHPEAVEKHDGDYRQFKDVTFQGDEVVYCSAGDGTTSEGEFWEAMNSACESEVARAVYDRGQRIRDLRACGSADRGRQRIQAGQDFPNLLLEECDGTTWWASYSACKRAVDYIRAGKGPALVPTAMSFVRTRTRSPMTSGCTVQTRSARKTPSEIRSRACRCSWCAKTSWMKPVSTSWKSVDLEVQAAADQALTAAFPSTDSIYTHVYSEDLDPRKMTSQPQSQGADKTMADLISACLKDEMRRDERIVVLR